MCSRVDAFIVCHMRVMRYFHFIELRPEKGIKVVLYKPPAGNKTRECQRDNGAVFLYRYQWIDLSFVYKIAPPMSAFEIIVSFLVACDSGFILVEYTMKAILGVADDFVLLVDLYEKHNYFKYPVLFLLIYLVQPLKRIGRKKELGYECTIREELGIYPQTILAVSIQGGVHPVDLHVIVIHCVQSSRQLRVYGAPKTFHQFSF